MTNAEQSGMSMERFAALIAAYGADAGRWPHAERPAAIALLAASEAARAMLEIERALDICLDALPAPTPSARLEQAILRAAPATATAPARMAPAAADPMNWVQNLWRPSGVFGTAAVLGMVLGLNIMGPVTAAMSSGATNDDVLAYAFPTYADSESGQ